VEDRPRFNLLLHNQLKCPLRAVSCRGGWKPNTGRFHFAQGQRYKRFPSRERQVIRNFILTISCQRTSAPQTGVGAFHDPTARLPLPPCHHRRTVGG
jgi:hypothetical protein